VILISELLEKGIGLKMTLLYDPLSRKSRFNIFASLAEFERDLISERTEAGSKAARARGRTGGRPKGLTDTAKSKAIVAAALYNDEH